ncbi:DUF547 domain-containing protein [Erythrobacter sp. MTPC3]|uniref:DUF547 domain-containing protein n=1 Tax=Erythrobacter sp. MTPC3 TaxID=3056564 RepID=UPI0036F2FB1C
MSRIPMSPFKALTFTAASAFALLSAPAYAQDTASVDPITAAFTPSTAPNDHRIDYSIWDEAMKNLVISMGPSLRQTAGRPDQSFGSRRQYGHVSRYRLEGSRIMFSFLDADVRASFGEYRRDLEATADKVDIQELSRNEQLAYWINLHNVAMIEKIAEEWPVRQPRSIEVGGVPLDDAKFITVEGISLSPRDIREKIVFANWNNPKVIYGFWRGDIGGPSIQREAFNADNVSRLLDRGARDFVNSLRGTQKSGDTLQVSELFEEAAPFFFDDFNADVRGHIAEYANSDVMAILDQTSDIEANISEYDIADLAGGAREPTYQNIEGADGNQKSFRIPQSMARLLAQRDEKFRRIIREGRTGTVTFSNITLPGDPEDKDANEVE